MPPADTAGRGRVSGRDAGAGGGQGGRVRGGAGWNAAAGHMSGHAAAVREQRGMRRRGGAGAVAGRGQAVPGGHDSAAHGLVAAVWGAGLSLIHI